MSELNQTEGNEIASVSEELAKLLATSQKLQENENAGEGVKADYILLAKQGTKALARSNKDLYIEGLSIGDLFIQKDRVNLGATLDVVPLAFITLYQEKDGTSRDANFFGVWNKEQANSFPPVPEAPYNRQLPNGHILTPVNWVMVEVIGHREIENAVIAYKSTGSRIWRQWKEDARNRSGSSATLVYTIAEEGQKNDKYSWTDIGFTYKANLLETSQTDAVYCLKKSNKIRESYEKATLIANRDLASLTPSSVNQIEDASSIEDATEDDLSSF